MKRRPRIPRSPRNLHSWSHTPDRRPSWLDFEFPYLEGEPLAARRGHQRPHDLDVRMRSGLLPSQRVYFCAEAVACGRGLGAAKKKRPRLNSETVLRKRRFGYRFTRRRLFRRAAGFVLSRRHRRARRKAVQRSRVPGGVVEDGAPDGQHREHHALFVSVV